MSFHQSALHSPFRKTHVIGIGGIEVGVALLKKMIHHLVDLLEIDTLAVVVQNRQPHESETQFFCVFRKKCHSAPPFFV